MNKSLNGEMGYVPTDMILLNMVQNSAIRDRRLFLCDEVTRESMFKIVYYMNRIKDFDDNENIPMKDRLPISIILDCYGGYTDHCQALMGTIMSFKEIGYHIITQVNSIAHSCGFMLLIMGSEKVGLRYARTMCHQISSGTGGEIQTQEEQLEESKYSWNLFKNIIVENTKITIEELDDLTKRKFNWYFDMQTALKYGVIDKII